MLWQNTDIISLPPAFPYQELNYADIRVFQKKGGERVQLGLQNNSDYSEVRQKHRPAAASSPPTYEAHIQRMKRQAPPAPAQPGTTGEQTYAQVRAHWPGLSSSRKPHRARAGGVLRDKKGLMIHSWWPIEVRTHTVALFALATANKVWALLSSMGHHKDFIIFVFQWYLF